MKLRCGKITKFQFKCNYNIFLKKYSSLKHINPNLINHSFSWLYDECLNCKYFLYQNCMNETFRMKQFRTENPNFFRLASSLSLNYCKFCAKK